MEKVVAFRFFCSWLLGVFFPVDTASGVAQELVAAGLIHKVNFESGYLDK